MGSWSTVWEIASRRYSTKRGEGSMSDHSFTILQSFVIQEQARAMKEALGTYYHGLEF